MKRPNKKVCELPVGGPLFQSAIQWSLQPPRFTGGFFVQTGEPKARAYYPCKAGW